MPDDHWRLLVSIAEGTVTRARARVGACGLGGCALSEARRPLAHAASRPRPRCGDCPHLPSCSTSATKCRRTGSSAGGAAVAPSCAASCRGRRPGVRQCCGASLARLLPAALCGSRRSGALLFCCPPTQGRCGTQRRGASRNKAERQALSLAAALLNIAPDASFFEVMG